MILVTGATGTIGSATVARLAARGVPTRALVRDPSRAPGATPVPAAPGAPAAPDRPGTEIAVGDFDRPETLDAALRGIDTVVLISPAVPAQEIAVVDSAVRQGVRHIVKITNHKATPDSPVDRRRDHARVEAHLRASGLAYTLLAPNLLMQNLLFAAPSIRRTRSFTMSAGDGRFGMVDAHDVAASAAAVAAAPSPHAGRGYLLTGPELISYADVARELTRVLGHPVAYRRLSPADHRAAMIEEGVPEPVATSNAQVFDLIAHGDAAWLSADVEALTAEPPRPLAAFLTAHASAFA
ncbi:NmrA family NAD(P)-binding protein [Actinacidiphila sp. DG2A-62]|uniref:NmrA family NAD(P)-binding protein n=1 Tax=Actinacidiphila sp. DG2A-62 TaxID=3108821 RepID=UPI002DBA2257|nr:NmrA family NAD(P)-binding protein [Actinacidiphila sp. DG2A-62]MEC3994231.1 NmrA family NAD(P)-binding protein [Actinacidiphila sp. DG2A-62]